MFCDSQPNLLHSDEQRVLFAKQYLEGYRFLYRDSNNDDKKVCHYDTNCPYPPYASNDSQNWRGRFGGPFVLQAFAAHLSAIDGSARVPNLHDKPTPNAVGALGLAAASVSALYHAHSIFLISDRWSGLWS